MRLAQELREIASVDVEVRPGWPSEFLVTADGRRLFSWWTGRRLPNPGELSEAIRGLEESASKR